MDKGPSCPTGGLQSRARVLPILLGAAVSLCAYRLCWTIVPPDYMDFLGPWYRHIVATGPVAAFAKPFSDYTPSYLYLLAAASSAHPWIAPLDSIKWLSVAGTLFLIYAVADLVRALGGDPRRGLTAFILPSVVLNAALLGQCDAIWAGACVLGAAAAIRGDCARTAIWSGVAIAFKAQAAFFAPFVIGYLWGRRAPWWCWTVPCLVYACFMVPAWLMGWPAGDLATVYLRQANEYHSPGNLANPWIILTMFTGRTESPLFVLGYLAAIAAALAIAAMTARLADRPKALLLLALLSSIAIPFLLPKMHERYYFLADVLAFGAFLAAPSQRSTLLAGLIQAASLTSILVYAYFFSSLRPDIPMAAAALLTAAALAAWAIGALWRDLSNELEIRLFAGPKKGRSGLNLL